MLGLALAMVATSAVGSNTLRTYTNVGFSYAACYPADFIPEREADNSDGRKFAAKDGATITVFGAYDTGGDGYRSTLNGYRQEIANEGGSVTYSAHGARWGVVSGATATKIYYVKAITRGDRVLVFDFEYPKPLTHRYSSLASALSKCFRPTVPA